MKKLMEIAETEKEQEFLMNLVRDMRAFTSDSLEVLKSFEKLHKANSKGLGLENEKKNLALQKKIHDNVYVLFEKMHRVIDYPSFVILDDELKKQYGENSNGRT